jgi:hypothetical protein
LNVTLPVGAVQFIDVVPEIWLLIEKLEIIVPTGTVGSKFTGIASLTRAINGSGTPLFAAQVAFAVMGNHAMASRTTHASNHLERAPFCLGCPDRCVEYVLNVISNISESERFPGMLPGRVL